MTSVLARACKRIAVFAFAVASTVAAVAMIAHAGDVIYQYDASGRLKGVVYPDSTTKEYKLDPAGNRTQVNSVVPTGGILAFAVAEYGVSEGAGTLQISVARTVTTAGAVSVNYATAPGTASAGSDYTTASGTLNWASGDSSAKTITITILNDTSVEVAEQFVLNLNSPTGGAVTGALNQTTITINDNDAAAFSISNASGSEIGTGSGVGSLTFTVTLSQPSPTSYQVNYASANGSALAGADYVATSGTLTFAANQTSQTITVPISFDIQYEGNETLTMSLSAPTGGATLGTSTATGTIVDDESPPNFIVMVSSTDINESAGNVTIYVIEGGRSDLAHAIDLTIANGTATNGTDFTGPGTLHLTFPPTTNGSGVTQTVSVPITNDTLYEGNETFSANLSNPSNGATVVPGYGTVVLTIVDDEPVPPIGTLQFTSSTASATEGVANVTLSVSRINGSYGAASVNCYTVDGTALNGSDYSPTYTTLNWANGDAATKSCIIPILDGNTTYEGNENFVASLTGVTGATLGTITSTSITLTDNDTPPVFSISATPSVTEGGVVTFTVTKSGSTVLSHNVSYSTTDGSATQFGDFTAVSGVFTFAPADTVKTFTVNTTQEAIYETNETFNGTLASPTNGATLSVASATTTINNDDSPPSFTISDATQSENSLEIVFVVTKTGASQVTHTVNFATANGSATAGNDYAATSGTLTFTASDSVLTIPVALIDDFGFDGDESLYMNLSAASNAATIADNQAVGTITENDAVPPRGTLQITNISAITVPESVGTVTVNVSRINGSYGAASVVCVTSNGSASAGSDFTAVNTTLNWADGDTSDKTCVVSINDDSDPEQEEEFFVSLGTPVVGATLGALTYVHVYISASDAPLLPATPGLGLNSSSGNNYVLGWNPISNATHYVLFDDIGNIKYQGPNTTATVVLLVCQSSGYQVQACNANGCSNPSNTISLYHDGPGCE